MRMVIMLLLGIFIGALAAVTAVSAMRQETPLSKALMSVSGHHFRALHGMVKAEKCDSAVARNHLAAIRSAANDLETAFLPTGVDDEQFRKYATEFRAALDTSLVSVPEACPALSEELKPVGAGCKACHEDFK